jgi:hypothetical protein
MGTSELVQIVPQVLVQRSQRVEQFWKEAVGLAWMVDLNPQARQMADEPTVRTLAKFGQRRCE